MPYNVYCISFMASFVMLFLAEVVCVLWRLTTVLIVDFYELLMQSRRHLNRLGTSTPTQ